MNVRSPSPESAPERAADTSGQDDATDALVIAQAATGGWLRAGDDVRARVGAYFSANRAGRPCESDGALPPAFATDAASGGSALRRAFPVLRLDVVQVEDAPHAVTISVRCEGDHRGTFFGMLAATGRRVSFDVVHRFEVAGGLVTRHRVVVDFRAIVRQIATARRAGSAP
jgi:hypothetical protein